MLKNPTLDERLTEAEASAVCSVLVTRLGGSYSRLLGIKLAGMESDESFKWFVAATLLGSPVRPAQALAAFRELESHDLVELRRLAEADESDLVDHLTTAGVTGYTRRIAATLKLAAESLVQEYNGDINRLHFFAEDSADLARRLRQLGRKVPHRAVNLFLTEMRGVWEKAQPGLSSAAVEAAVWLGIIGNRDGLDVADELRATWDRTGHSGRTYADFEVALARLGENYCEVRRCISCPMGKLCISRTPGLEVKLPGVITWGSSHRSRTESSDKRRNGDNGMQGTAREARTQARREEVGAVASILHASGTTRGGTTKMASKGQPAKPAPKPGAKK